MFYLNKPGFKIKNLKEGLKIKTEAKNNTVSLLGRRSLHIRKEINQNVIDQFHHNSSSIGRTISRGRDRIVWYTPAKKDYYVPGLRYIYNGLK